MTEEADAKNEPVAHLILTHGASQPMTSRFFETLVPMLLSRGISVSRFEFAYMRQIRETGKRRPPPKIETMFPELVEAVDEIRARIGTNAKLLIGGKSMGGRIASMLADELLEKGQISGLVCLGYPFHPPKKPDSLRTAHLADLKCPALIVQGERDPFGTQDEVADYALSPAIELCWAGDGDHDFGPRGGRGFTRKGNIEGAANAIARFAARI
ncbi:MAG: dienelactone hydrolase family protein [Alphaproteobacteria bacterium]|nr:dienelactone hydrolase family protein [Alphaproteobacteria bacterium]